MGKLLGWVLLLLVGFGCVYFAFSIVKEIRQKIKNKKTKPPNDK